MCFLLPSQLIGTLQNWDQPDYPTSILYDPRSAPYTAGVAWHCYGGNVTAQSAVQAAFPSTLTCLTECSDGTWVSDPWDSSMQLLLGALQNWARGVVRWGLALDPQHEPYLPGGCNDCTGIVTVNGSEVLFNADYWSVAHFSPFTERGSVRIASGAAAEAGPISNVAFLNADGSIVLVAYNTGSANATFAVNWLGQQFLYSLGPQSAATFRWAT